MMMTKYIKANDFVSLKAARLPGGGWVVSLQIPHAPPEEAFCESAFTTYEEMQAEMVKLLDQHGPLRDAPERKDDGG